MTTKGSCLCGEIELQFTGDADDFNTLCHCRDCQKWTGSAFTPNAIVKQANFKVTKGTPKTFDVAGASGKNNRHFFCANCGSSLYTELEIMPGLTCVKGGVLDGGAASLGGKISVEIFCKDRVSYLGACEGAKQEPRFG